MNSWVRGMVTFLGVVACMLAWVSSAPAVHADVAATYAERPSGESQGPTYRADLFEGDIKLTEDQKKAEEKAKSGDTYGLTNVYPPWDNGVIVYQLASSIGYRQRDAITKAMNEWTTKTGRCITFKRRTNERNYLEFYVGNGCWGHMGQPNGKSQISVGAGCEHQHVMSHEIGHALGFWHEQSRPDRDQYLQVLWNNVPAQFKEAFAKYGKDKIDSLGVPFDYTSIMQYPWNAFSTTGRDTLKPIRTVPHPGPYVRISDTDVKQVKLFYKCGNVKPVTGGPVTPNPPVTKCVDGGVDRNCRDTSTSCASWASRGECKKNPAYMKTSCCKSCNAVVASSCVDKSANCASWAQKGECAKNPAYMDVNCKKSCKKCGNKCVTVAPPTPGTTTPHPPPPEPTTAPPPPVTEPETPPPPPTVLPSTSPPIPPTCIKPVPVGVQDKLKIPDSSMSASSSESFAHEAHYGRLMSQPDSSGVGAWCAAMNDKNQYLQVDMGSVRTITGVKTQGREGSYNKWVRKYTVSVSQDGNQWQETGSEYQANSDPSSVQETNFNIPRVGRYVRVTPTEWSNMICMRVEIMVCA